MKNIGMLLLAIWLIVFGLTRAIGLNFAYDNLVIGVLAIIAGVMLILKR